MTRLIGKVEDELGTGLFPSYPGRKPLFWSDGRNVTFDSGLIKAALGQFVLASIGAAAPILGVKVVNVNGVPTVYFGISYYLYKYTEAGGIVNISPGLYIGDDNPWVFAVWGEWIAATNNVDPVQLYKNTGNFADLSGPSFTRAKLIEANDTHVFAFNTSNGANFVEWCDLDDIEDWTATSTNEAGNLPVRNLDSEIIAVKKLGDKIIFYTYNEMFAINYVGRPFIYGIEFLLEGFGPVGPKAVASVGKIHYGLGRSGLWVTDGVSFQYIDEPAVFDFIYQRDDTKIDPEKINQAVVWHDKMQNMVMFSYPRKEGPGYNDIQIGFNYKDQTKPWTIFNYGRTSVDDGGVFPFAVAGDSFGTIYQQSVTNTAPSAGTLPIVSLDGIEEYITIGVGIGGVGQTGVGGRSDALSE